MSLRDHMEDILCVSETRERVLSKSQRLFYGSYVHVIIHSKDIMWKSVSKVRVISDSERSHDMWLSEVTVKILCESHRPHWGSDVCVRGHNQGFMWLSRYQWGNFMSHTKGTYYVIDMATVSVLYEYQRTQDIMWESKTIVRIFCVRRLREDFI